MLWLQPATIHLDQGKTSQLLGVFTHLDIPPCRRLLGYGRAGMPMAYCDGLARIMYLWLTRTMYMLQVPGHDRDAGRDRCVQDAGGRHAGHPQHPRAKCETVYGARDAISLQPLKSAQSRACSQCALHR
jgi:hypothetical protein